MAAMSKMVMFELRNGEKRLYRDVERVDDSRSHLVLVYGTNALIAQINKRDVVRVTWHDSLPASAPPPIRPPASHADAKH
jgi:hypothetical protein